MPGLSEVPVGLREMLDRVTDGRFEFSELALDPLGDDVFVDPFKEGSGHGARDRTPAASASSRRPRLDLA